MMVMTRSTNEKLNLNYIELTDDEETGDADENDSNNKLLEYLPKFK